MSLCKQKSHAAKTCSLRAAEEVAEGNEKTPTPHPEQYLTYLSSAQLLPQV